MITHMFAFKWSAAVQACPINLAITPYGQALKEGETLERCILDWAEKKRGPVDGGDLLSIVVNNPRGGRHGRPRHDDCRSYAAAVGAVFETCQNA